MNEFQDMMSKPASRRAFLQRMGAAGLGVAAASLIAGCGGGNNNGGPNPSPSPTNGGGGGGTVFDPANFPGIIGRNINETVLNFALTLEILEADLYRQALNKATGRPLTQPLDANPFSYQLKVGPGNLDATSGNATTDAFEYLRDFSYVEVAHRQFLRMAIQSGGGTPQPPNPGGYAFPKGPGDTLAEILTNILALEETGVRAYLGAGGFLTDLGLLQTALTIYSTEARHSAVVNYVLGKPTGPYMLPGDLKVVANQPSENTFEYYQMPTSILQTAKTFFV